MKRFIASAIFAGTLVGAPVAVATTASAQDMSMSGLSSSSGIPAPPVTPPEPADPDNPAPQDPVDPEPNEPDPTVPEEPIQPDEPIIEDQPVEPVEPDEPVDPVEPDNPDDLLGGIDLAAEQAHLAQAASDYRLANGVGALEQDPQFDAYAQDWAEHLATTGQFYHDDLYAEDGVIGENIVILYSTEPITNAVDRAWHNSPEHRDNMLYGRHEKVGHGVAEMQTGNWEGQPVVVQKLGR